MDESVERVVAERRRRGLSVRAASTAGDVSNQTWANYEKSGVLTPLMQRAIVKAFDWPADWADAEPAIPPGSPGDVVGRLQALIEVVQEGRAATAALEALVDRTVAELHTRIDAVERALPPARPKRPSRTGSASH